MSARSDDILEGFRSIRQKRVMDTSDTLNTTRRKLETNNVTGKAAAAKLDTIKSMYNQTGARSMGNEFRSWLYYYLIKYTEKERIRLKEYMDAKVNDSGYYVDMIDQLAENEFNKNKQGESSDVPEIGERDPDITVVVEEEEPVQPLGEQPEVVEVNGEQPEAVAAQSEEADAAHVRVVYRDRAVIPPPAVETREMSCGPDIASDAFVETKLLFFPRKLSTRSASKWLNQSSDLSDVFDKMLTPYVCAMNKVVDKMVKVHRDQDDDTRVEMIQEYQESPKYREMVKKYAPYAHDIENNSDVIASQKFASVDAWQEFMKTIMCRLHNITTKGNVKLPRRCVFSTQCGVTYDNQFETYMPIKSTTTGRWIRTPSTNQAIEDGGMPHVRHRRGTAMSSQTFERISNLYCSGRTMLVHLSLECDENGNHVESTSIMGHDLLVLSRSHLVKQMIAYIDQHGIYWVVKMSVTKERIKQTENDFKYIKMFGFDSRFVIPQVGRCMIGKGGRTHQVLLYKIGSQPYLKKVDKVALKQLYPLNSQAPTYADNYRSTRALKLFCGSMCILLTTMGYSPSLLSLNCEGKILATVMNGKRRSSKQIVSSAINQEYLTSISKRHMYYEAVSDLISSGRFGPWKDLQDLMTSLRLKTNAFDMTDSINSLSDQIDIIYPSTNTSVVVYGTDGYLIGELPLGKKRVV